jgi:hypothetical protein
MNMRIWDKMHGKEIYDRLSKKLATSLISLRPMSYYDVERHRQIQFDFIGTQDHFEVG